MLTSKKDIINRKVIIAQSGFSERHIYEKVGISRIAFYKNMRGKTANPKTHEKICKVLRAKKATAEITKETFWPEFYPEATRSGGPNSIGANQQV
jgi:DNA-binding Xre family transcriptional regulator